MAGFIRETQKFVEEVQVELRRVTWPDWDTLKRATLAILVFVLILAAVIGLMDMVFAGVVRFIVRTFGA